MTDTSHSGTRPVVHGFQNKFVSLWQLPCALLCCFGTSQELLEAATS